MADVENQPESSFPVKRKPDLYDNVANKSQKLEPSESKEGEDRVENLNSEQIETEPDKAGDLVADVEDEDEEVVDRKGKGKGISREDKGKGKMIEVEESDDEEEGEEEEDSDEDDDVGFGEEDDESDLSDDPLAEVDLDNILPSRTRRRSTQPGVYISNENRGNVQEEEEEEEDDSSDDDSDA